MKKKSLLQRGPMPFLLDMVVVYFEKKVGRAAAELSYFLVLTVFPILICINAFFSTLNLDFAELLGGLDGFLPAGVTAILTEYVSYLATNQSSGLIVAGLFTTILLAAAAVRSLMDIMEEIYGSATFHKPTNKEGNYWSNMDTGVIKGMHFICNSGIRLW